MLALRIATRDDLPRLREIMAAAIDQLQRPHLTPRQIAASHAIMGLDTTLVDDGTYFVVESGGAIVGCGGWSRRATMYGGDHTAGRSDALVDPAVDPARVRAMYTHPDHARQGVGLRVLRCCEQAARAEGFRRLELVATPTGRPFYQRFGFEAVEELVDRSTGTPIPLVRMRKDLEGPKPGDGDGAAGS